MSEINVRIKSPIKSLVYSFVGSSTNLISEAEQYLNSLSILEQPITSFKLVEDKTAASKKDVKSDKAEEKDVVNLSMVLEKQTYADVSSQIEQLRKAFELDFVHNTSVNSGAIQLQTIPVVPKKKKGVNEETILEAAEFPQLPSTSFKEESFTTSDLITSAPNPMIPKPAALDLRFSVWQPLCRDPRIRMQGIIAFVYLLSNDGKEWHFVAYPDGFVYVPQLSNTNFVLPNDTKSSSTHGKNKKNAKGKQETPKISLQYVPTLVQAIEFTSPSTISHARKNRAKSTLETLMSLPVNNLAAVSPWLVKDVPPVSPYNAAQLTSDNSERDWNEEFQLNRELNSTNLGERVARDSSLCDIASDFALAATDGVIKIMEGAIKPLNVDEEPSEEAEDESSLYLNKGIFYTYGSDFAQNYVGVPNANASRKVAKKDLAGVEQLMRYQNTTLCPVLSTVVDYCGERLVAQAPVPGIFRETEEPLITYGQAPEHNTIQFNEKTDELMKDFADMLHLKQHVVNKENLKLQTSLDVHGTQGTDGRTYAIDLCRLHIPDLISKDSELNLIRFEAVGRYLAANPDAERFNPDVWMNPKDLPDDYAKGEFQKDIENVEKIGRFVREDLLKSFIDLSKASDETNEPVDGFHLTSIMHGFGLNMRLLGLVYNEALANGLKHMANVSLIEAVARSLKVILREKMIAASRPGSSDILTKVSSVTEEFFSLFRSNDKEIISLVENRLKEHFNFTNLPDGWDKDIFSSLALMRSVSIKMGLQWNEDFNLVAINPVVRYAFPESSVANEALEAGIGSLQMAVSTASKDTPAVQSENSADEPNKDSSNDTKNTGSGKNVSDEEDHTKSSAEEQSEKISKEINESLVVFVEAIGIFTQIYGFLNISVANVLHKAAILFYEYGDDLNSAIEFERRAIVVAERVAGVDSFETLKFYQNLAFYEKASGNTLTAIELNKYIIRLTSQVVYGDVYKDAYIPWQSIGEILLESKKITLQKVSCPWLEKAVDFATKNYVGVTGRLMFLLCQSYCFVDDIKKAKEAIKKAHELYEKSNGPDDFHTKETQNLFNMLNDYESRQSSISSSNHPKKKVVPSKSGKSPANVPKAGQASVDAVLSFIMGGTLPVNTKKTGSANKKNKNKHKK